MTQEIIPTNRSHHLQAVIECITEKNNSPNKKIENQEDFNIDKLYGKAGNIIAELDTSINRCKKYNQAKINRKYQIVITDLQSQIKKLSQKLKLQQDARSPTKKHISDILDKLVIYRDQNANLKRELQQKNLKIKQLQDKLQNQTFALLRMQNQMPRATIQRLPAISNSFNVNQAVKQYLKDKELVKKITKKSTSALQKFLINHKTKMWNWTIANLLEELDKWGDGIKEKPEVDMWRIRSSIARKFSDMIDDSGNLTRPNRFGSIGSEFSTGIQPKYYSNKKLSNFSYKGSKQQLNLNISTN